MRKIGISATVAMLLCTACAIYKGVDESSPSAELSFAKSYTDVNLRRSAMQAYAFGEEPLCAKIQPVAIFTWATGDHKTVRFAAGKRIAIVSHTNYLESGVGMLPGEMTVTSSGCDNTASFVPEAGHSYELSQHASMQRCAVEVVDRATGAAPPSLQPVTHECAAKAAAYTGID